MIFRNHHIQKYCDLLIFFLICRKENSVHKRMLWNYLMLCLMCVFIFWSASCVYKSKLGRYKIYAVAHCYIILVRLNHVQRIGLGLRSVVDIVLIGLVVEFVRYPFLMGNIFLNYRLHQGFLWSILTGFLIVTLKWLLKSCTILYTISCAYSICRSSGSALYRFVIWFMIPWLLLASVLYIISGVACY